MSGTEGIPGQDPAAANLANQIDTPEVLASRAEQRLEEVYDLVTSGLTGVRDAFWGGEIEGDNHIPALYVDGIGYTTIRQSAHRVTGVVANRSHTTETYIASLPKSRGDPLKPADATLGFDFGDGFARLGSSQKDRADLELARVVRLISRDGDGNPLYEDVAFRFKRPSVSPALTFAVRRGNREGHGDTDYSKGDHVNAEEFTRIMTEATDIVLAAARPLAAQSLAKALPIVEACQALEAEAR